MTEQQYNWAGNYAYSAARLHYPRTVEQVQDLVSRSSKVRALGSRHSFNGIADTPDDLISLEMLDRVLVLDRERHTVTVDGGMRYGQLCPYLDQESYALHNLASLPHISVAGACATATHGSGDQNRSLAGAVAAMEVVTAGGEAAVFSRDPSFAHDQQRSQSSDPFQGMVVALGALGVVTRLTLDIEPAFRMRQVVYENLPLAQLEEHFEAIVSGAYSVSLLIDWRSDMISQVWLKSRVTSDGAPFEPAPDLFGATPALQNRHPILALSAVSCNEQMGVPGPWYSRLPHFRNDFTPSSGEELQSEYLVPREHAFAALHAIYRMRDQVAPLVQVSEVRTVAADNQWMSPFYRQACVAFHFTWWKDWPAVRELLPLLEAQLTPFGARPHWGKLFTMPPDQVRSLYEKLPDFQLLLERYDPEGKFRNPFLDAYLFAPR